MIGGGGHLHLIMRWRLPGTPWISGMTPRMALPFSLTLGGEVTGVVEGRRMAGRQEVVEEIRPRWSDWRPEEWSGPGDDLRACMRQE